MLLKQHIGCFPLPSPPPTPNLPLRQYPAIKQPFKVDLHFRTLDFGQVTVGSANVRNLAVTNNLPHAILAELLGLDGRSELAGSGPPAQVVPAGATAGFDMHFKCHTEQARPSVLQASTLFCTTHARYLLSVNPVLFFLVLG